MLKTVTLKVRLILAAVLVAVMAIAAVFVAVVIVFSGSSGSAQAACAPANEVPTAPSGDHAEQIANAKIIDKVAASLGLSGQATRVGIIAAIGESSLINIPYGDGAINPDGTVADSAGLFQQQPHTGWGTPEQVMDPEYATTSFFIGKQHDRQGGLVAVEGWESMEPTVAIHIVQGNLVEDHYAQYYSQADSIISEAGIDVSRPATGGAGGAGAPAAPPANCATGTGSGAVGFPLDKPFNMTDNFGPRIQPVEGASTYHPADDLQNWPGPCGHPVYAIEPGTVTLSDLFWLSVKSPDGYTVSYLHMYKNQRLVDVGQTVTMGQQLGVTGSEGPSTGCHLDLRIDTTGTTNAQVAALPHHSEEPGFIDPELFYQLFGQTLCDDTCKRNYDD